MLDRQQVYPSGHKAGSEGVPERVPRHAVEAGGLIVLAGGSDDGLRGLDRPHKVAADGAVGSQEEELVGIVGAPAQGRHVHERCSCRAVQWHAPGLPVFSAAHGEEPGEDIDVLPLVRTTTDRC